MKVYDVKEHFDPDFGEYVLGSKQTGRNTVYLVLGELAAGESRPMDANGHEELLLLAAGRADLEFGGRRQQLRAEQAVHVLPQDRFVLHALTDCRYVVAGGHPEPHGHGH